MSSPVPSLLTWLTSTLASTTTTANSAAGTAATAQTDASNALTAASAVKAGFAINPTVYDLSGATVKTDYAADLSNNKVTIFTSAAETQCIFLPVDPLLIVPNTPYRILNANNPAATGGPLPIHVQLNGSDGTPGNDITTVAPGETCRVVYVAGPDRWFKIIGV